MAEMEFSAQEKMANPPGTKKVSAVERHGPPEDLVRHQKSALFGSEIRR